MNGGRRKSRKCISVEEYHFRGKGRIAKFMGERNSFPCYSLSAGKFFVVASDPIPIEYRSGLTALRYWIKIKGLDTGFSDSRWNFTITVSAQAGSSFIRDRCG